MLAMHPKTAGARPGLALASAVLLLLLAAMPTPAFAFGFAAVVAKAQALAHQPYQAPPAVPKVLRKLTYDQYRAITFKKKEALWPKLPFQVEFYMPGLFFKHAVKVHVVADGKVKAVPFSIALFDFGDNAFDAGKLPSDLGFAGFNIRYTGYHPKQSRTAKTNEVMSVLGASYFRVKGAQGEFGVSARGLAINTTTQPEEFPNFIAFWLVKPAPDATAITFYALLDSPSASGAYRFIVHPGETAVTDVKASIFLRQPVAQLGLAPLSSMYMYGLDDYRPPTYLRPAVHDSQGLLIQTAEHKWIWRPLANPPGPSTYTFALDNPRGFGLMQRNRDFLAYQSLSMNYQARPSAWVEPVGDLGQGHVVLYEFSSPDETNDNIVAFWQPARPARPGTPIHLAYRIHWGPLQPERQTGRVVNTFMSKRTLKAPTLIVLDFAGGELSEAGKIGDIKAHIDVGTNGKLAYSYVKRNDHVHGWRLVFKVAPTTGKPVQLRAYLAHAGKAVTETWDYVLAPGMQAGTKKP